MSFARYAPVSGPNDNLGIPPRALNGGLYTGEPFKKDAPWGNVPVIPDAGFMVHYNLRSANPPQSALYQYPGTERPGNNTAVFPGVGQWNDGKYGLACIKKEPVVMSHGRTCQCRNCSMAQTQYAYL